MRRGKLIFIIVSAVIVIACIVGVVVYQIREMYAANDPFLQDIIQSIRPLFDKEDFDGHLTGLNKSNILDTVNVKKSKTGSYTINKKHVYICMTDDEGTYYDRNMLVYVLIHELAHVLCDEIGHTEKFNTINDELLVESARLGLYDPSLPVLMDYCAHHNDGD